MPARKTGPSKALGVVKFVIGAGLALGLVVALCIHGHEGAGAGAAMGLFAGLGLRWMLTGGANVAGRRISVLPSLAVPLIGLIAGGAAGPALSDMYWRQIEQTEFEECVASENVWDWNSYIWDIPDQFHRPEAKARHMRAEVLQALQFKDYSGVRLKLATVQAMYPDDRNFDIVLAAAADGMGKAYDEALAKLTKPGDDEAADASDEDLRAAFAVVLKDLSTARDADVYVAFSNSARLATPPGHEDALEWWKSQDMIKQTFPDGNVKIIDPGEAFSARFDAARRNTFMTATQGAFKSVFDANLLSLRALQPKEERAGKLVLEVTSEIRRTPTYFNNSRADADGVRKSLGLLFGVEVAWGFKVFDRQGKQLYERQTVSQPAENIRIEPNAAAPEWGVYSILMDSAYYNYARQVISQFGLTPPAEKTSFRYTAHKE